MALFKNEQLYVMGRPVTRSLVLETCDRTYDYVLLTLKEDDLPYVTPSGEERMLLSLPKLYMQHCSIDPTEYKLANEVFGSWNMWTQLSSSVYLKEPIDKLRAEIKAQVKSKAVQALFNEMYNGKQALSAAKFLYEKDLLSELPDKQVKKMIGKANQAYDADVEEDASRVLRLVK